jgi:hypothetical protein
VKGFFRRSYAARVSAEPLGERIIVFIKPHGVSGSRFAVSGGMGVLALAFWWGKGITTETQSAQRRIA